MMTEVGLIYFITAQKLDLETICFVFLEGKVTLLIHVEEILIILHVYISLNTKVKYDL